MKRLLTLLLLLALPACLPPPVTLVPPETLAAQTLAALPRTDTPIPTSTETQTPTATIDPSTPTPSIDLNAPGAYCLPTDTERSTALVTRVLAADLIEVASGNDTFRVRYIGIDAPDIAPVLQWQGPQAIATNERLVGGKIVTMIKDVSDSDVEGNLLRYVIADNAFVNYELVRMGYALASSMPPAVACDNSFVAAQVEAQTNVMGVWMATPVPTSTITPTPTITLTPTQTRPPVCNCLNPALSCSFFATQRQAQSCYDYCVQVGYGAIVQPVLDKNLNGKACEGTP